VKQALFFLALQLMPAVAMAAEAEHHHEPHGIPWAKLIFSFINLGIFLYLFPRLAPAILPKLGLPGSKDDLRERQRLVVDALEKAAKAKQESERLQVEWQQRLASLDGELQALRAQAEKEVAAEREQILAAARRLAETIRRDAQRAAEQEVRNAENVLREEVAKQAFAASCRLATSRIGESDQRRFVSEFIDEVKP
jgi:F0F1-type ATP synthase membrane subunit b/b'